MDPRPVLLENFPSMEMSNLLEFLKFGVADCCLFPIPEFLRSLGGGKILVLLVQMEILVPLVSLEPGVEVFLIQL